MVRFDEYRKEYHDGVVSCVMRNFEEMRFFSKTEISRWMEPMFGYPWENRLPEYVHYKHGIVMLSEDEIVGYTGCFFSSREIGDRNYIVCKVTTTAIDERFRLCLFKMLEEIMRSADVVITYTPIDTLRKILEERYHFSYFDRENEKFYPVPCMKRYLAFRFIMDANEIDDDSIRQVFQDHVAYGIKCMEAQKQGRSCFVFYRRIWKKMHLIGRDRYLIPFVQVLEVTDRELFGENARAMIWTIQKREKAFLETDSRFLGNRASISGGFRRYKTWRMFWSKDESFDAEKESALYSELSILDDYRVKTGA